MNEMAPKDRLKAITLEKDISINEVWKLLLLERFLGRLPKSKQQDKFIFKGGLLLSPYLTIGRETVDADSLIKRINSNVEVLSMAIQEIVAIDLMDGFNFELNSIKELSPPHMEYPGFRMSVNAAIGKMKDIIQIDIGVGDVVKPVMESLRPFKIKGKPLLEGEITLLVYPVETIFAEKLQTIISKGGSKW